MRMNLRRSRPSPTREFLKEANRRRSTVSAGQHRIRAELAKLDRQIGNLVDGVAAGADALALNVERSRRCWKLSAQHWQTHQRTISNAALPSSRKGVARRYCIRTWPRCIATKSRTSLPLSIRPLINQQEMRLGQGPGQAEDGGLRLVDDFLPGEAASEDSLNHGEQVLGAMLDFAGQHVVASLGCLALSDVTHDLGSTATLPVPSFTGDTVRETSMRLPSLRRRTVS